MNPKIFGSDGDIWPTLTDDQFARLAGEWFLCSEAREAMGGIKEAAFAKASDEHKALVKAALERRWMLFYTLKCLLEEKYQRDGRAIHDDIVRLSNPKWLDEEDMSGTRAAIRLYCNAAREVLTRVYRVAAKAPRFVQRNWYRSDETLRDLLEDVRNAESMIDSLPFLRGSS